MLDTTTSPEDGSDTLSVTIIGAGRAGSALTTALRGVGVHVTGPLSRNDDPTRAASGVDAVIIAVPDASIGTVAARIAPGSAAVLHLSGAMSLEPLRPHRRIGSMHPLMTLPDAERGGRLLTSGISFAIEGDECARALVERMGGHPIEIEGRHRAAYHAAASVAATHAVALWGQIERIATGAGVPPDIFWPLMRESLQAAVGMGASDALTGPAARGDWETIRMHLEATDPAERSLYLELATEAALLAGKELPPSLVPTEDHGSEERPVARHTRSESDRSSPMVVERVEELRDLLDERRRAGDRVGFVPTMGALHEGHMSLARQAVAENDVSVLSIFVNPLQFDDRADLELYPRDLRADVARCGEAGVSIVFAPAGPEMFPDGVLDTEIAVPSLARRWEGASRPGHFAGVATIVAKLFAIVGPCRAYFGEKDYQQLQLVRRMTRDLNVPVAVVGCAIVREDDGLAMSSRNVRLGAEERIAATALYRCVQEGVHAVAQGERDPTAVVLRMGAILEAEPLCEPAYVAVVDSETLEVPTEVRGEVRLLAAASFGAIRLIDNAPAKPPDPMDTDDI